MKISRTCFLLVSYMPLAFNAHLELRGAGLPRTKRTNARRTLERLHSPHFQRARAAGGSTSTIKRNHTLR